MKEISIQIILLNIPQHSSPVSSTNQWHKRVGERRECCSGLKILERRDSLVVHGQDLALSMPGVQFSPGRGTTILQAKWPGKPNQNKQTKNTSET